MLNNPSDSDDSDASSINSFCDSEQSSDDEWFDDPEVYGRESGRVSTSKAVQAANDTSATESFTVLSINQVYALCLESFDQLDLNNSKTDTEPVFCHGCEYDSLKQGRELYSLECGHLICKARWCYYLRDKVPKGISPIKCPHEGCTAEPTHSQIVALSDKATAAQYMNLMLEQFLHDSPNLIRCPSRTCDNAISFSGKVKKSPRPLCAQPDSLESYTPVSYTCGVSFCFNCHFPNHDPAPCEVVRHSQTKVKNMLLFVLLKKCPKCNTSVEKCNDSNQTTCLQCFHKFCWFCRQDWYHFNHDCRFENTDESATKPSRYERMLNTLRDVQRLEKYYVHDHPYFHTYESISEIERTLSMAFQTIKWSYSLKSYLKTNLAYATLDVNLKQLEKSVVDVLEQKVSNEAEDVSLMVYRVVKWKSRLLKTTMEDLKGGQFEWTL